MKATRSIQAKSVLAILVIATGLVGFCTSATAAFAESPATEAEVVALPEGMQIPPKLPKGVSDPNLMAGWVWLWNTETGRPIAEHIRGNNISIEYWNGPVNSAPVKPVKVNGRTEIHSTNKIQISNQTPLTRQPAILAGMLAHEGYHSQLPFGPNLWPGSIYEEYQAYELQQKIYTELYERGWTGNEFHRVPLDTTKFDKYDPHSLADYGNELGEAYSKCKLYPWDK